MQFRIADTFTDSLARLTGDEQKAVKTTAFDLQMNPAHPGLKLHQVDRAKDNDFWSVRVSRDIRLIAERLEVHSMSGIGRRLHPRARPAAGDRRGSRLGVPRRPARGEVTVRTDSRRHVGRGRIVGVSSSKLTQSASNRW